MDEKQLKTSGKATNVSRNLLRRSPRFNPLLRPPEPLQKVEESNDTILNINCLPEEILLGIFQYLSHSELSHIARVCQKWSRLARCPQLWKKVDILIKKGGRSQNKVAATLSRNLPIAVTYLKLDFNDTFWRETLKFEPFCMILKKKCPFLKVLILHHTKFSISLKSVIDLSRQYFQNLEVLSIHTSLFSGYSIDEKCCSYSKLKVLDLCHNISDERNGRFQKLMFSKMSNLKKLNLDVTGTRSSWFQDDFSFLNTLEVLNLRSGCVDSSIFKILQNHALKLVELYLCYADLKDSDFNFSNAAFPQLKSVCLKWCIHVTCEGIVSLICSIQSLQNVYVHEDIAGSLAQHPFFVANKCKLSIVKTLERCLHFKKDYLYQ